MSAVSSHWATLCPRVGSMRMSKRAIVAKRETALRIVDLRRADTPKSISKTIGTGLRASRPNGQNPRGEWLTRASSKRLRLGHGQRVFVEHREQATCAPRRDSTRRE